MELAGLAAIVIAAWFWIDTLKSRDTAIVAARRACESEQLQFLDESVSLSRLALGRDDAGRLKLRRVYTFEYSDTGNNRCPGSVMLLGSRVFMVNVGLRAVPEQRTLH
jgi:hypothetical protein